MNAEQIKTLEREFPRDVIGVKVQATNKDKTRAMLVLYLQHCDVARRIEEVDPAWTFSAELVQHGNEKLPYVCAGTLTVLGVARDNVGEGETPKEAYSDALKRCAMLFGVGRYLYFSDQVWVAYDPQKDKYAHFTIEQYEQAAGKRHAPKPQSRPAPDGARKMTSEQRGRILTLISEIKADLAGTMAWARDKRRRSFEDFTEADAAWLLNMMESRIKEKQAEGK